MFSLETRTGTTASAHSSAEAAPTEAASASETASAKAADKWTASATSPVMVVIIITLLATYDGMSAVSTCIGDIFGLHSINPGYDSASASLQLMFTAIRTATLFACRKESKTSANGDKTKDGKNKIKRTTVILIGESIIFHRTVEPLASRF